MKKILVVGLLLTGMVSAKADITFGYGWDDKGNTYDWMENRVGGMTFGYGWDSRGNTYSWDWFDFGWSGSSRSGGFLGLEEDDDE